MPPLGLLRMCAHGYALRAAAAALLHTRPKDPRHSGHRLAAARRGHRHAARRLWSLPPQGKHGRG